MFLHHSHLHNQQQEVTSGGPALKLRRGEATPSRWYFICLSQTDKVIYKYIL